MDEIIWEHKPPEEGDIMYGVCGGHFLTYQYVKESWTLVASSTLTEPIAAGDTVELKVGPITLA